MKSQINGFVRLVLVDSETSVHSDSGLETLGSCLHSDGSAFAWLKSRLAPVDNEASLCSPEPRLFVPVDPRPCILWNLDTCAS